MRQKKNKFFTFIFSFLPGAAEMYMGFMKTGMSIMAVFFLCIMVPAILRISDIFILPAVLVWFCGFFHARNLAACDEERFQNVPDEFVWEPFVNGKKLSLSDPALRKWGAGILLFCGVIMLWQNIMSLIYSMIPDIMWEHYYPLVDMISQLPVTVFIIIIGVKMMLGKKKELDGEENENTKNRAETL